VEGPRLLSELSPMKFTIMIISSCLVTASVTVVEEQDMKSSNENKQKM
jgi:hypothetical protein